MTDARDGASREWGRVLWQLIAILVPGSVVLWWVTQTAALPDNDYWSTIGTILTRDGRLSWSLDGWVSRGNEHRLLIPRVFYAANLVLFHGSNTGLAALAWIASCLGAIVLFRMLPVDVRLEPRVGAALALLIGAFVFTPRASHNWIMGMSGVTWLFANLFVLVAIASLCKGVQREHRGQLIVAAVAGVLGYLTYTSALAVWPVLVIGAFVLGRRRTAVAFAVVGGVVFAEFLMGHERPQHHPELATSVGLLARYVLTFLGGAFTLDRTVALGLGGLGVVWAVVGTAAVLRKRGDGALVQRATPWVLIMLHVGGNAVMAGGARGGFGLGQALASRYATLPAMFWLSLWVISFLLLREVSAPRRRRLLIGGGAAAALSVGAMAWASIPTASHLLEREGRKRAAGVSMASGAIDIKLLERAVSPAARGQLVPNLPKLRAAGHVPFVEPLTLCARPGEPLGPVATDSGMVRGFLDADRRVAGDVVRIRGWAHAGGAEVLCIAIANPQGVIRGAALPGYRRDDVARALKISDHSTGWQGYARRVAGDGPLRAHVLVAGIEGWHPLERRIGNSSGVFGEVR